MALVWEITDVHRAANERGLCLTNQEARDVLANLHDHYNPQLGIRWEDIYGYLEAKGLGRKLTKHELNQFVQKDSLTINR